MKRIQQEGLCYVGLGDELESVDYGQRNEMRSVHYGFDQPITFPRARRTLKQGQNAMHDGQRKLAAADSAFIGRWKADTLTVIAVGGSPGHHFADISWMYDELIIMDPRQPAVPCTWIQGEASAGDVGDMVYQSASKSTVIVINDIRRDEDPNDRSNRRFEEMVEEDWCLGMQMFHAVGRNGGAGYSFKFRIPHGDNRLRTIPSGGMIFPQPYVKNGSTESRLFYDMSSIGNTPQIIEPARYRTWIRNYSVNQKVATARWLEGNLMKWMIRPDNIMEVTTGAGQVAVGLFSVSNAINKIDQGFFDNHVNVVINTPIDEVARKWPDKYYRVTYGDKVIVQRGSKREDKQFTDATQSVMSRPFQWKGVSFWRSQDLVEWWETGHSASLRNYKAQPLGS